MQTAITYFRYYGNGDDIVTDCFQVIDEVADCKALFDKLEESLSASWDLMYEEAKKYYSKFGDLEHEKTYRTESGYRLGQWVSVQRRVRNGKAEDFLDKERIEKLDAIGMRWDSLNDLSWNRHSEAYKKYIENGGDLQLPSNYMYDGVNIEKWLTMLRRYESSGIRSSCFTPERKKAIEDFGVVWNRFDYVWEQNYQVALAYYIEHGNLEIPSGCVYNGVKLYNWLADLRKKYRQRLIDEEQILRLNKIGMRWESQADIKWEKGFEEAKKYSEQYGASDAPYAYVTPEGYKLGIFLTKCREKYAKGTLSQERIDRLNSINMIWSKSKANEWETCFALVKKYYEEHGDIKIPAAYKADGIWLNKWLNEQKLIAEGKRKGKTLSEKQIGMLESVGFECRDARDVSWEQKCSEIKNNYIKDGKVRVPVRTKSRYGDDLYQWYQNQIAQYRNGRMRADRSEMFRAISV